MMDFQVIEIAGKRVLTTKQLAEAYETEEWKIKHNFGNNRKYYTEGKHFIKLEGADLRDLKTRDKICPQFKYAKSLYLWTEKGALLHAKSINTDKAWEVYDYLVDFYFRVKSNPPAEVRKEPGSPVINIPESVKSQNMIQKARDYMTAIDVELQQINKYISEEKFENHKAVLVDLTDKFRLSVHEVLDEKLVIVNRIL